MKIQTHRSSPHTRLCCQARSGRVLKTVVFSCAALVILSGASWGVWAVMHKQSNGKSEGTLETHLVSDTSFNISTTCNGELEAKNQIEVRSKLETQSTIAWIIKEGENVKKDDVLVKLNCDDLETRKTESELQVETSKAELEKAETALKIQEKENSAKIQAASVKYDLAKLALEQWEKGDKVQKQKDNTQAIDKAVAEHDRLKEKYEKSIELEKEGFLSTDELKRDKLAYDEAARALEKAQLAQKIYDDYESVKDGTTRKSDVDQSLSEFERAKQQAEIELKSKESARNTSKRQLEVQEQKLTKLKESIENATLKAPAAGLVVYSTSTERGRWDDNGPLQIGRQVYPNQMLIVLPDVSEMIATVRVHESLQSRIKPGLVASVKIDAAGGRSFEATVDSIGILAESGGWRDPNLREYSVKLNIRAEGVPLKPAMRCEAELIMGRVENAVAVPLQAIFNEGVMRYVCIPEGGKFVRRPVSIGRMSERFAEIKAGLESGERVLLREPKGGEILDRPWEDAQLTLVGLKRDSEGQIVRAGGGKGHGGKGGEKGEDKANEGEKAAADKPADPAPAKPTGSEGEVVTAKDGKETEAPKADKDEKTSTPTTAETEKKTETDKSANVTKPG